MDKRILLRKRLDFQVKSESLVKGAPAQLGTVNFESIRIVQVYDVFDLAEGLVCTCRKHISL